MGRLYRPFFGAGDNFSKSYNNENRSAIQCAGDLRRAGTVIVILARAYFVRAAAGAKPDQVFVITFRKIIRRT